MTMPRTSTKHRSWVRRNPPHLKCFTTSSDLVLAYVHDGKVQRYGRSPLWLRSWRMMFPLCAQVNNNDTDTDRQVKTTHTLWSSSARQAPCRGSNWHHRAAETADNESDGNDGVDNRLWGTQRLPCGSLKGREPTCRTRSCRSDTRTAPCRCGRRSWTVRASAAD